MSEDHKVIYLEPPPGSEHEGRMWCEDSDNWDHPDYDGVLPTKYIRADIAEKRIEALEAAIKLHQDMTVESGPFDSYDPEDNCPIDNNLWSLLAGKES